MPSEYPPGLFWHVHHDELAEFCYDLAGRIKHIRRYKAPQERGTRIRLIRPVQGPLPEWLASALRDCTMASKAHTEALQMRKEAVLAVIGAQSTKSLAIALERLVEARKTFLRLDTAQAYLLHWRYLHEAIRANMPALEALHKRECRNCSWNGKTIFPKRSSR